jgi:hypothetical protein
VIALEFNPVRVGFHGGPDVWTRDVLNLGVKPDKLIALVSQPGWRSLSVHITLYCPVPHVEHVLSMCQPGTY